jgi:hypothetical protein
VLVSLAQVSDAMGWSARCRITRRRRSWSKRCRTGSGRKKARARDALVDVDAIQAFAREFQRQFKGKWMTVQPPARLGGFCLLIRCAVLERERIGPALDEFSDLSLFDSDIVSAKAHQARFSLACCRDLFIYHFGTRTFAQGAPQPGPDGAVSPAPG